MSRSVSERWKRRVGRHHWALEEDEFVRYSPSNDDLRAKPKKDTIVVIETPLLPQTSGSLSIRNVSNWGTILFVVAAGFVAWKWWRRYKIPPSQRVSLPNKEKGHGERDGTKSTRGVSINNSGECEENDAVATKQEKENDQVAYSSGIIEYNHADSTRQDVGDLSTEVKAASLNEPNEAACTNDGCIVQATTNADKIIQPLLVPEKSQETKPTPMALARQSNTRELVAYDDTNHSEEMNPLVAPFNNVSSSSRQLLVATAQDAETVAQAIRVTQSVFENHGLSETLATEWAMRRQESELSESARQRHEEKRMYIQAVHRHEDRKHSERQFREMRTSMEYDKDWLLKIQQARDKCLHVCMHSFSVTMVILLVAEAYQNLPRETSAVSFVAMLLGCNCDSATDTSGDSDVSNGWTMTCLSSYSAARLVSSFSSFDSLLCHTRCFVLKLLPPFCVQVVLRFCQCPRLLHQVVTMATMASLFSSQLVVAGSYFAWSRLVPMVIVTLLSTFKAWHATRGWIEKLQNAQNDMRKQLENALISMDWQRFEVMVVHAFFFGFLLVTSSSGSWS